MTVTVEWFENEETKGKELDIKTVLAANPELNSKSKPVADRVAVSKGPTYVEKPSKPQEAPASVAKAARPASAVSSTPSKPKVTAAPKTSASGSSSSSSVNTPAPASKPPAPSNAAPANAAAKKAPSKTLQEIQKLEKQREERRAKAQEKAVQKDQRGGKDNVNEEFMQMIDDFRDNVDIHPLDPHAAVSNQKITVCIRKRPLNKKELANFDYDVVTVPNGQDIVVHEPKTKVDLSKYLDNHDFRFDHVFDDDITNATIYRFTAAPLVRTIFEGGFATCFAYGQTGLRDFNIAVLSRVCDRKWQDLHDGR
jgi:kinesin family protein 2/24